MNGKNIQQLVDRGIEVREKLAQLEKELEEIEGKLRDAGLKAEQQDLKDDEREGKRWLAHGTSKVVPVIFTADKIVGQFKMNSPLHSTAKLIAGEELKSFFKLQQVYENQFDDGKKFRKTAGQVLGVKGPAFITACLARDKFGVPKSDVRVNWDDAGPV